MQDKSKLLPENNELLPEKVKFNRRYTIFSAAVMVYAVIFFLVMAFWLPALKTLPGDSEGSWQQYLGYLIVFGGMIVIAFINTRMERRVKELTRTNRRLTIARNIVMIAFLVLGLIVYIINK